MARNVLLGSGTHIIQFFPDRGEVLAGSLEKQRRSDGVEGQKVLENIVPERINIQLISLPEVILISN